VVVEPRRFVSRGGLKLEAAIETFGVEVEGRLCLDAGASTGGFSDCLLKRGAGRVFAVDVGHGQLAREIATDPRVVAVEGCNIRNATLESLGAPAAFQVVVADLSFISLRLVARKLSAELASSGAQLIVLVKPQFEAGREVVNRGRGVIRDASEWRDALLRVGTAFAAAGSAIIGVMASPILGPAGNAEFFLHLHRLETPDPGAGEQGSSSVDQAIEAAAALTSRSGTEPDPESDGPDL